MPLASRPPYKAIVPTALTGGLALTLLIAPAWNRAVTAQDTTRAESQRETALSLEGAFENVAQTIGPATVSITARIPDPPKRPDTSTPPNSSDDENDRFGDIFGDSPQAPRTGRRATGSGVIVRADGYILTNDHIVEEAQGRDIEVTLSDGSVYTGKAFRDEATDLAVVKINPEKPLPTVRFADSGKTHVGQWAIAIGSPFGQQNTMTTGIVSALHRRKDIRDGGLDRFYPDLIQTDASINPGNSGGPLLNIRGELVGINVAIFSPTGTSAGIGYAIPANTARRVMEALITNGKVTRGRLGIIPTDVPPGLRKRLGVSQGAYITEVDADTPADKAGIFADDVVTHVGDTAIENEGQFRELVAGSKPGTVLSLTILRNGKTFTTKATVEAAPNRPTLPPNSRSEPIPVKATPRTPQELGFIPSSLTDEKLRIVVPEGKMQGVFVRSVQLGSPAFEGGMRPNSIITAVNGTAVTTIDAVQIALSAAQPGETVTLRTLYRQRGQKPSQAVVNIVVP